MHTIIIIQRVLIYACTNIGNKVVSSLATRTCNTKTDQQFIHTFTGIHLIVCFYKFWMLYKQYR